MRPIDADKLFAWNGRTLSDATKYGNKNAEQQEWSYSTLMMYEIADEIDDAPTIDAVPVVRCGECKRYKLRGGSMWCVLHMIRMHADDFCSYGRR